MAMAGRLRSTFSLFNRVSASESLSSVGSYRRASPLIPQLTSGFVSASGQQGGDVKVPVVMTGEAGKWATSLYLASVKSNVLDKVESELRSVVEATKSSPTFGQFTKDITVPKDTRVKAIFDICEKAKFSEITRNFLALLAESARLKNMEKIVGRFFELTEAHRGDVKVLVTTVMPLPPAEEKELKETLQEVIGQGKKVTIEQKIDPSIYGGLIVEYNQKVLDMSIKTRAMQMERLLREPVNFSDL
ncbi:PREDICTED: ATP synthase subunit O, mitochondrial-like [Tarenaya hassleriana]|uniref:ATP synthase subunit O, mitochondrial-like n=1 Tax=Tarenaya hassleriana TaxID=28532 RepID=UPI00053C3C0B|nr:PREDICTED: ATP synthase subunit O, mitochondrial-like [Tarenaya hassleriana]